MEQFREKVVIITGATSGIGEATAKIFAKEGASVVLVGRNVEKGIFFGKRNISKWRKKYFLFLRCIKKARCSKINRNDRKRIFKSGYSF